MRKYLVLSILVLISACKTPRNEIYRYGLHNKPYLGNLTDEEVNYLDELEHTLDKETWISWSSLRTKEERDKFLLAHKDKLDAEHEIVKEVKELERVEEAERNKPKPPVYHNYEVNMGGIISIGYAELGGSFRKYLYNDLSAIDVGASMYAYRDLGRSLDNIIYLNHKLEYKTFFLSTGFAAAHTILSVYEGNASGVTAGVNFYFGNRWKAGDNFFIEIDWYGIYRPVILITENISTRDNTDEEELRKDLLDYTFIRLLSFKLGWRF